MTKQIKVDHLDHVHVYVPDRHTAAKWYHDALGLSILKEHEHWAVDPNGPLMISSDNGNSMLALFNWELKGPNDKRRFSTVAFRVSGENFVNFVTRKPEDLLFGKDGNPLDSVEVVDHEKAFSIYFYDPYGNQLEITTYDYAEVKKRLADTQK